MTRDLLRKWGPPGSALAAGLVVAALDCAGLTGTGLGWGLLELCSGLVAGSGFAALWMRPRFSRMEKILAGLLIAVCIFTVWPWIPFGVGLLVREPEQTEADRRWLGRIGFVTALVLVGTAGIGMVCFAVFPPGVPPEWWFGPLGALAAAGAAALGARYALRIAGREAVGVACRTVFAGAAVLTLEAALKLRVWRPEPWGFYAGLAVVLAASGYGLCRLRLPGHARRMVRGSLAAVLVLCTGYVLQDHWLDVKYYHLRIYQKWTRKNIFVRSMPVVEACRAYRARTGAWPDAPEKLAPLIPRAARARYLVTGCHTEANGDFLLVMRRPLAQPMFARRFHADGRESWEIVQQHHPLAEPGAKRWKHPFPYTD